MAFTEKAKLNGHPNDCSCLQCASLGEMFVDSLDLDSIDLPDFDDESSDADMYAENEKDVIAAKRAEIKAEGEKLKSQMSHPENFNEDITYPKLAFSADEDEEEDIDTIEEDSEEAVSEEKNEE